jgi:hypothetical protein
LDFDKHLRTNPNSEIIGELNRINAVLQDFITDIGVQDLRRRSECLLCFSDVDLSNSSNLCISSLRLINGFFNTPLWLLTVSAF